MFLKNVRRFTLMEMMIVVFVIATLVGIATISASSLLGQSKGAALNADAKTLESAIMQFQMNDPEGDLPVTGGAVNLTTGAPEDLDEFINKALIDKLGITTADAAFISAIKGAGGAIYAIDPDVNKYVKDGSNLAGEYYIIGNWTTATNVVTSTTTAYNNELAGMLISRKTIKDQDGYSYNALMKIDPDQVPNPTP